MRCGRGTHPVPQLVNSGDGMIMASISILAAIRTMRRGTPAAALLAATVAGCAPPAAEAGLHGGAATPILTHQADGLIRSLPGQEPARASGGMVSSAHIIASEVGAEVLRAGGNAVDAAIATGMALAVVYPTAGNIGGGGFMVIRFPDGRSTAFDFREMAPAGAHPEMWVGPDGEYSSTLHHDTHLSVGVPGTVAGFALAHERYGRLPWARLVEPAVRLAGEGFRVTPGLAGSLAGVLPSMRRYPGSLAAFYRNGAPYAEGETWRQPDLARTLERIMREGRDGFYRGETARLIVAEMARGNGIITEQDLANYVAHEREAVRGTFRGYEVIGMSPPSSGGIALQQMLNILEGYDLRAMGHNSAAYMHHLTEAMRLAYRDRARFVADPAYAAVPVARLTSKEYAATLRAGIDSRRAAVSAPEDVAIPAEGDHTTHYSVVDGSGLAVSVTYTLENAYGSRITVTGAGFLLNNEMGDFNGRPGLTTETGLVGTPPNLARPGQRMISSMTPTIIARDGQVVAVFGSPGGRTIINTVTQIALNLMEHGMPLDAAVEAKRIHHQWLPDRLRIEQDGAAEAVVAALRQLGHDVSVGGRQGSVHAIQRDGRTGAWLGYADSRDRDGAAVGF
jgi:gamma-glutamyltranspeptidase / glutathione hydrolase